jgi:hypothetical protein
MEFRRIFLQDTHPGKIHARASQFSEIATETRIFGHSRWQMAYRPERAAINGLTERIP